MSFPLVRDSKGRDVRLPLSEVAQINRLVAGRPDIRRPIELIEMVGPDRAYVRSGRSERTGDSVTVFHIVRKSGIWLIEEGSVYQTTVVITS